MSQLEKIPHPAESDNSMSRWSVLVGAGICLAFAALTSTLYYSSTLEDAFITFRYAEHLAEGYGYGAWNRSGPKVDGCTTPLWLVLLAGAHWVGLSIEHTSKVLGAIFFLATVATFFWLAMRPRVATPLAEPPLSLDRKFRLSALLGGALMATSLPLAWYAVSGMELALFIALSTWVLFGPYLFESRVLWSILSVLLVLVRPEGIVIIVLTCAFYGISDLTERRIPRAVLLPLISGCVTLLSLTAARQVHFGWPLPNTYYAKMAGEPLFHLSMGWEYLKNYVGSNPALFATLVVGGIGSLRLVYRQAYPSRQNALGELLLWAFVMSWVGYVVKTGGDNYWAFPFYRHFLHVAPILAFVAARGLSTASGGRLAMGLSLACAISIVDNASIWTAPRHDMAGVNKKALEKFPNWSDRAPGYHSWFLKFKDTQVTVAAPIAGRMPYIVDAHHIDVLGLNDEHIAHLGKFDRKSHVDSKADMGYVMSRRPHVIGSTISAKDILEGKAPKHFYRGRGQMVKEMFQSGIFQAEYSLLKNGPYGHWDRAIFIRTDFCDFDPSWECLKVSETSISRSRGGKSQKKPS